MLDSPIISGVPIQVRAGKMLSKLLKSLHTKPSTIRSIREKKEEREKRQAYIVAALPVWIGPIKLPGGQSSFGPDPDPARLRGGLEVLRRVVRCLDGNCQGVCPQPKTRETSQQSERAARELTNIAIDNLLNMAHSAREDHTVVVKGLANRDRALLLRRGTFFLGHLGAVFNCDRSSIGGCHTTSTSAHTAMAPLSLSSLPATIRCCSGDAPSFWGICLLASAAEPEAAVWAVVVAASSMHIFTCAVGVS